LLSNGLDPNISNIHVKDKGVITILPLLVVGRGWGCVGVCVSSAGMSGRAGERRCVCHAPTVNLPKKKEGRKRFDFWVEKAVIYGLF